MTALEQMACLWDQEILNKVLPPRAANIPADRVCYNVPASPLSFDFIHWLVDAEMTMFRGLSTPVIFLQNVVVDPSAYVVPPGLTARTCQ